MQQRVFSSQCVFYKHLLIRLEKLYFSEVWKVGFSQMDKLKRQHTSDTNNIKFFVCKVCDKEYVSKKMVDKHCLTHCKMPLPFICEICNVGFSQKNRLEEHCLTHNEKPFISEIHNLEFSQKHSFTEHHASHTNSVKSSVCNYACKELFSKHCYSCCKKPFSCEICKLKFSQKEKFKKNHITHTNGKSFVCDLCKKAFSHQSKLDKHLLSHYKKPFICEVCNATFSEKKSLSKHLITHTSVETFYCDACNKKFSNQSLLSRHFIRMHFCCNSGIPHKH